MHWKPVVRIAFMGLLMLCLSCGSVIQVTPAFQRVVILRDTLAVHKLSQGRRLHEVLGASRRGDTLASFAKAALHVDTLEHYFYVIYQGSEGWIHQGNGQCAQSEYDLLVSVCDTRFLVMPSQNDSAWKRALHYAQTRSVRPLQTITDELIAHSKRDRVASERDIEFVIRRSPQAEGVWYTIRANGSGKSHHARRCALFIQTGKDEQDFQGVEYLTPKR
jgi:hypothetical protein